MLWKNSWQWTNLFKPKTGTPSTRHAGDRCRYRPQLEQLEGRSVPAFYTWTGAAKQAGGNDWWSNPGNWRASPMPGMAAAVPTVPPGAIDDVGMDGNNPIPSVVDAQFGGSVGSLEMYGGSITLARSLDLRAIGAQTTSRLVSGTITGNSKSLTILGGRFSWTGGTMNDVALLVATGVLHDRFSLATQNGGALENRGTTILVERAVAKNVTNLGTMTLGLNARADVVTNSGTIGLAAGILSSSCVNTGTSYATTGDCRIGNLDNRGSLVVNGGILTLQGNTAKQSTQAASTILNAGELQIGGPPAYELEAGQLVGSAAGSTIIGNVNNSAGNVYAGGSTGTLEIVGGTYTQGDCGVLNIGINPTTGTTSKLQAPVASLSGMLFVTWLAVPASGSEWDIGGFGALTGDFTDFLPARPTYFHIEGTTTPYKIKVRPIEGAGLNINANEAVASNGQATFAGGPSDDPADYSAVITWGDGTQSPGAVTSNGNGGFIVSGSHIYADDNPTGTPLDTYATTVTITSVWMPDPFILYGNAEVANDPPQDLAIELSAVSIFEGDSVTLTGSFADAGLEDTHVVVIVWGDGSSTTLNLPLGDRTFQATHQYLDDNPTGSSADVMDISVTVTDDDTGEGVTGTTLLINDLSPDASLSDVQITGYTFSAVGRITDIGILDYWIITIDWGDGSTTPYMTNTTGTFNLSHTYAESGTYLIDVIVRDDDAGLDEITLWVTIDG